jgi:hypothetical protein
MPLGFSNLNPLPSKLSGGALLLDKRFVCDYVRRFVGDSVSLSSTSLLQLGVNICPHEGKLFTLSSYQVFHSGILDVHPQVEHLFGAYIRKAIQYIQ